MIYCDYNASAPLSDKLRGAFFDLPFANPSSQHSLGKKALKIIHRCEEYLQESFQTKHTPIFHSGSTEGSNLFILGKIKKLLKGKKNVNFVYLKTDHSCIRSLHQPIEQLGVKVHAISVEKDLNFPQDQIAELIKNNDEFYLFNFTWVHNESGVAWKLEQAAELKALDPFRVHIHVDATQSIGKIPNYLQINNELDCYTYSAHKFGGLKGVGWSFVKDDRFEPLTYGGGHQHGLRPGTLNTHGIYSIQCALEELAEKINFEQLEKNINFLREKIFEDIKGKGKIVELEGSMNLNTIFMYFNKVQSQILLPALDMKGLYVGTGSACSSGSLNENYFLGAIGFKDQAQNSLRLSVSPYIHYDECEQLSKIFKKVIDQF